MRGVRLFFLKNYMYIYIYIVGDVRWFSVCKVDILYCSYKKGVSFCKVNICLLVAQKSVIM